MTATPNRTTWMVPALLLAAGVGLSRAENAMAYEEPSFVTIEQNAEYELREYQPYVVAEVEVRGRFEEVGNQAFELLFDYISGKNHGKEKIAMTVPVEQQRVPQDETIAMTAPVTQSNTPEATDVYRFSFIMPPKYSLSDVPRPGDSSIEIREVPARLVAARRYSGRWSEPNYRMNEAILVDALRKQGLQTIGSPVYARYNSPFSLWFLRRNEVMVEVAR